MTAEDIWEPRLPEQRGLYYGGRWHEPAAGGFSDMVDPGRGVSLGTVANADAGDVDRAVEAARRGFLEWRDVAPLERARILKEIARILRANAKELATIDAANCGNPVTEMMGDAAIAAAQVDFFAGLVTEMKGASIPMGPDAVNFSMREPLGVVARILAYNHPFMFCGGKMAAPLAAGNSVIVKPPAQAPLSTLRLAELVDGLLPSGVFNVLPGGTPAGAALAAHPGVAKVTLIGSVAAGRAVMRAASETIKPVLLELGGKNALIAYPDSDPRIVARAAVAGMNFTWCGQSCGSTSRAFVHSRILDDVLEEMERSVARFRPGIPTRPSTTMGALVSRSHFERVMEFIESAKREGARLVAGGGCPTQPELAKGNYIEPTIFAGVEPHMRIAREEIFGPVLAVREWSDEAAMIEEVNALEYGLTCSIWTRDLVTAHRTARRVEAGFVWINEVSKHFLGAPFGGVKQSGIGREECLDELLSFTHEKNIHVSLAGH
ncbi:aldehyde dehydrogenase family protein [Antarcticirhabdus aurantiaca]|uniref:aldehyde dehydrogenase family protein n=1 Tax=Antarcticirhabdus aurantiaca TaxID=2606717 RepID=UPI001FEE7B6F|nr:aldehyde dehydrogenase family protein [Antarcticirhabdus aurantiaca]